MKACAKILGVVLVVLAIQLTLAVVENHVGDTLVSRAFTVASNINSLVSRAFTVSSNTDTLVSRAFTVSSNTDSLVSRAFTVSSNIDSLVSRAFTVVVNCDDGLDGLCPDCDNDGMPDGCELDCGPEGGPCFDFPAGKLIVRAPAASATRTISATNVPSARVASMGLNSTSSV